jgi:hypothetical protein
MVTMLCCEIFVTIQPLPVVFLICGWGEDFCCFGKFVSEAKGWGVAVGDFVVNGAIVDCQNTIVDCQNGGKLAQGAQCLRCE